MERRRLIIFSRYPEPGKTKTRLIPALGPDGAAALQRDMTRHVIGVARTVSAHGALPVEIRFDGGDVDQMELAFGSGLLYRGQGRGDLGERLLRAFVDASREGAERTVVIGADCPEITAEILEDAFERLSRSDLVLGPADDGGYYLLGLRRPVGELFAGIPWGRDRVLEETVFRARQSSLTIDFLETLSDIDRPEDLPVWQRLKCGSDLPTSAPRISVVIPTLNEAGYLHRTLASVKHAENVEIIVADGGSQDGTIDIAKRAGCRVLHLTPGRALQLNAGAEAARGELLLFLHADTRLPERFDSAVRSALSEAGVVTGVFRLHIDSPGWSMRCIERAVNIRTRFFRMPYGDQGIFVRKKLFQQLGGFPLLPIMDDYVFIRRIRRHGKIRMVQLPATTSGRRWRRLGPWRTTWINQKVILGYHVGIAPERLAAWYRGVFQNALIREEGEGIRLSGERPRSGTDVEHVRPSLQTGNGCEPANRPRSGQGATDETRI